MDNSRSQAIKKGLAEAKKRGVRLGNPRLEKCRNSETENANLERIKRADEFAEEIKKPILALANKGITKPSALARELNKIGIPARKGGKWTTGQVQRIVNRLLRMAGPPEFENYRDVHDWMIEEIFDEY